MKRLDQAVKSEFIEGFVMTESDSDDNAVSQEFKKILKKITLENAEEVMGIFKGKEIPSYLISKTLLTHNMPHELEIRGGKIYLTESAQKHFTRIMVQSNLENDYDKLMHLLNLNNINPSHGKLETFLPEQIPAVDIERIVDFSAPIADGTLLLHGTCDNQAKYENETPLLLSRVNQVLTNSKVSSHIIDGPTITGDKFDQNTFNGLTYLLQTIMQNSSKPLVSLNIIGHSRGACEAIAINNLLCLLVNSNFDIKATPKQLSKYVTEDIRNLCDELKKLNKLDKIGPKLKINLVLLDPVRGPKLLMFKQDCYFMLEVLYGIQNTKQKTQVILFTAQNETRGIMDLWFPSHVDKKHLTIDRYRVPTKHGHLIRYGTEEKEMGNSHLQNAIYQIVGFSEIHKTGEYDKIETKQYAKGSKRADWSPPKKISILAI